MDIQEQIERYILGQLEGDELSAFEQKLASDQEFVQQVERRRMLIQAIQLAPKVAHFKEQLKAAQARAVDSPKDASVSWIKWVIAAVILVLLSITIWFVNRPQRHESKDLFAIYFRPGEIFSSTVRGKAVAPADSLSAFNLLWEGAEADVAAKQYDAAIRKWDQLLAMPEGRLYYDDLLYFKGITCLQADRAREAIACFKAIQTSYPSEKMWYLALALYKAGEIESSRSILEKIAVSNSPYAKDAKALLQLL